MQAASTVREDGRLWSSRDPFSKLNSLAEVLEEGRMNISRIVSAGNTSWAPEGKHAMARVGQKLQYRHFSRNPVGAGFSVLLAPRLNARPTLDLELLAT